ncbi:MAG: hypothetical protein KKC46_02390 [Proteobacteria bacterium]|nr:hypothetical protein [Pseudomonadota bacterium]
MKNKIAVLLNHPKDFDFIKKKIGKNILLIAHEQHTRQILKQVSLEYFYEPSQGDPAKFDEVKYFTLNWHRDENGRDLSFNQGISPGQIISGSAWIAFASYYREYNALKRCLEQIDILNVSKNEHPRFLQVAKTFGDQVRIYDPGHSQPCLKSACAERVLNEFPLIRRFSLVARCLQKLIMPLVRQRKHLYVPDWTSDKVARNDPHGLCQNSGMPWKGFYFSHKTNFFKEAEQVFPEKLGEHAAVSHLGEVLSRIGAKWDDNLLFLCSKYLKETYLKYRSMFIRTYAIYRELLHYYQPSLISVPGEAFEPYTIILQIAKSMGITTRYLGDGFGILATEPLFLDDTGKNWLFDEFAGLGKGGRDNYLLGGARPEQCLLMAAPLLSHHKNLPVQDKCYDAIVMTWIPMHWNPYSREEFGGQMTADVIRLLMALGKQRIAVKIKAESQRGFYETILKAEGLLEKVEILSGMFYKHVLKADIIIGGISSAVAESFYHGIPYYIYEPYENGYSNAMIEKSCIVSPEPVSRTINDLKINIIKGRIAVGVTREYMFGSA